MVGGAARSLDHAHTPSGDGRSLGDCGKVRLPIA